MRAPTMLVRAALTRTALVGAAVLLLRRCLVVVAVSGGSMLPAVRDGDVLLARRGRARVGDVVVLAHPADGAGLLVKRVAAVAGDPLPDAVGRGVVPPRSLVVLGDNGGVDSRLFGVVPERAMRGVVLRRLRRGRGSGREYVVLDDPRSDPLPARVGRSARTAR